MESIINYFLYTLVIKVKKKKKKKEDEIKTWIRVHPSSISFFYRRLFCSTL